MIAENKETHGRVTQTPDLHGSLNAGYASERREAADPFPLDCQLMREATFPLPSWNIWWIITKSQL